MHLKAKFIAVVSVLAASGVLAQDLPTNNVLENVKAFNQEQDEGHNTYHISTVNKYVQYIESILAGPGPITFFAPSDHSFIRLQQSNPDYLKEFLASPNLINATLHYHITHQIYDIATAGLGHTTIPTDLYPGTIDANIIPNDPAKNPPGWVPAILQGSENISATIVHTMKSSNGILYVIDTMLRPAQALLDNPRPFPTSAIVTSTSTRAATTSPTVVSTTRTATVSGTAASSTSNSTSVDPAKPTTATGASTGGSKNGASSSTLSVIAAAGAILAAISVVAL
ncbi:uncharacterized protein EV422DRAFT_512841 [Fimicolochytrium jonesii]|uniref:uncharacterized protein n=1 Tax=Fimicolochytrium jonesii TaxID=1396493 RepID=UPI0022FE5847|nr:uncharacterized protein EV422DRAFT_512841 [Fimicolochytrium jonesii]KAI8827151.1 hypothetical protein EV422DRAFT_512841 [Fimicolochytrium jonesii]